MYVDNFVLENEFKYEKAEIRYVCLMDDIFMCKGCLRGSDSALAFRFLAILYYLIDQCCIVNI